MFQLKLLLLVIMLAGGASGYFYVQKLRADNELLKVNEIKLTSAVTEQQALIEQQKKEFEQIQSITKDLTAKNEALEADKKNLTNKLGRHDLGNLAENKPGLVEKVINKATVNANRCLEIASGAELTEDESNASTPSQINPECWRMANPNFDPEAQSDAWKEKNL
jgi:hypothetical protein